MYSILFHLEESFSGYVITLLRICESIQVECCKYVWYSTLHSKILYFLCKAKQVFSDVYLWLENLWAKMSWLVDFCFSQIDA